jgi:uncharacterized membrane protein YeaQ/YmgE (transglycosylase-associated protein family)
MDIVAYIRDNPVLIVTLLNGLVAGWLAGLLLGGGGLIRNLIVGVIGAVLGSTLVNMGWLTLPVNFDVIPYGNQIAVSTIGAMIVVVIARFLGGR